MERLGLAFVANHFDVVPVRTNDESRGQTPYTRPGDSYEAGTQFLLYRKSMRTFNTASRSGALITKRLFLRLQAACDRRVNACQANLLSAR